MDKMSWIDEREQLTKEERSKEYFNICEGENKFWVLSHATPLAQVWNNAEKKYDIAKEGAQNISIKGVCWVLQDDIVKLAKLPYTVMKQLRAYQNDSEWELEEFPWPHLVTLNAKNAGSKEVEYTITLSPKKTALHPGVLAELAKKPTPEEMVSKMKEKKGAPKVATAQDDHETELVPF